MADVFSVERIAGDEQNIGIVSVEKLRYRKAPLVLFGAGVGGCVAQKTLNHLGIRPDFFCDNDSKKQGTKFEDTPVIDFHQLVTDYSNSYIIITSIDYKEEISQQLKEHGLSEFCDCSWLLDNIWIVNDMEFNVKGLLHQTVKQLGKECSLVYSSLVDELSRRLFYDFFNYRITLNPKYLIPLRSQAKQYFEPGIIRLGDQEIFIDCGAYTGDTVEEFLRHTDGKFKEVYSFEPEIGKHDEFKRKFRKCHNIHLMSYGLWYKTCDLQFFIDEQNPAASKISGIGSGGPVVPVVSLDEILKDQPATFIKMDIEGAELQALKGAEQTIKKYRPKLAISVYHQPLDIVEIPLYIKSIVPEYQFYLRHYSHDHNETVLYGISE